MLVSLNSPVSWIHYILVPVTRIELSGSNGGIWSEEKFSTRLRKMAQPEIGGVRTTEDEGITLKTPSDDEVFAIPSQEREDLRKVNIRGEHLENTQREEWLLSTEPRHGTRPRQTGAEHPPATEDSVFKEAADLPSAVRHRNGTLRLSPGRRTDMEEVFTSPRGGGHQAPQPQDVQSEARVGPKTVPKDNVRDSGEVRRNFRSPKEMLVNAVSHMQRLGHAPGRKSCTENTNSPAGGTHDYGSAAV